MPSFPYLTGGYLMTGPSRVIRVIRGYYFFGGFQPL